MTYVSRLYSRISEYIMILSMYHMYLSGIYLEVVLLESKLLKKPCSCKQGNEILPLMILFIYISFFLFQYRK